MAMEQEPQDIAELVARIEAAWNALEAQIAQYPEDVLTGPTDAAGWTIRDHLAHLTAWEASVLGFIQKIVGNTVEHYPEHAEWIAAIADSAQSER